ncbi:uncharacterized protein N7477_008980 [Penicillium maclennaniae]|uniref:uncharacterized protein n=1 Tax=Penicillium maclennaniae TaxID=1343394 RepID=UPI002540A80F|nr:uncharacterized protein N7477_008980 [Penicillium maclennaniae]KAJ5666532.1 hypothetical protein N7477_008980 [Penicillium maclennaniae]
MDGQNCDECDSHSVVVRPERRNYRTLHIYYGNIALGNSVLKDAILFAESVIIATPTRMTTSINMPHSLLLRMHESYS